MRTLAEREAHWAKWPNGDAGDAIDYALGHIVNPRMAIKFLEEWRDGRDFLALWPAYARWLAVQRDGASAAVLKRGRRR